MVVTAVIWVDNRDSDDNVHNIGLQYEENQSVNSAR